MHTNTGAKNICTQNLNFGISLVLFTVYVDRRKQVENFMFAKRVNSVFEQSNAKSAL